MILPLTSIWERYILKSIVQMFCLCLFGFYGLYVLINYSSHSSSFHHYHLSLIDITTYYLYDFITRIDFLVPFALLIAFTKTLCSLNTNNELTALLMAGLTYRRILVPFILTAFVSFAALYISAEFASPLAAQHYRQYEQLRASNKHSKHKHPHIQQIALSDGSSVFFQKYNGFTKAFEDAYWIRSIDDIYRIESLQPLEDGSFGNNVEHLQRNNNGQLIVTEKKGSYTLQGLKFNKDSLLDTITDPNGYALSDLHFKTNTHTSLTSEKEAAIMTTYYRKLALPMACFLAFLIPLPLCLRFTRMLPSFFIYTTCIFSLVVFFLVMNAFTLLGERQVINPALAVWVPCAVFLFAGLLRSIFYR